VRDQAEELLVAADVARLSNHPQQAVAPLRQLMDHHPTDARAPVAAFTLGRVLLEELGEPAQAAAAFSRSRELDPHGALAEDALAREVEAWAGAGDLGRANALARQYVASYPEGRRSSSVRNLGGIP
jgi:transmembrane sensor